MSKSKKSLLTTAKDLLISGGKPKTVREVSAADTAESRASPTTSIYGDGSCACELDQRIPIPPLPKVICKGIIKYFGILLIRIDKILKINYISQVSKSKEYTSL